MFDALISAGSSILGGLFDDDSAEKQAQLNYERQKEFAQKGIQWRVADAKQAGLHPLYALGGNTSSFTPVSSSSSMGSSISRAGEAVARGMSNQYERKLQELNLQNIQADIDHKKALTMGAIADAKRASNLAVASSPGKPRAIIDADVAVPGGKLPVKDAVDLSHPMLQKSFGDEVPGVFGWQQYFKAVKDAVGDYLDASYERERYRKESGQNPNYSKDTMYR